MSGSPSAPQQSGKVRLAAAVAVLLIAVGGAIWRNHSPKSGPAPKDVDAEPFTEQPKPHPAPPSAGAVKSSTRPSKSDAPSDDAMEHQMSAWLSDNNLPTDEAARRLWKVAADPRYAQWLRIDALANCLNLADEPQFMKEFVPTLGKDDVWTGEIAQTMVDNLSNRSEKVKVAGLVLMFQHAEAGPLRDNIRELLVFQLDGEDADDAKLIQMANDKVTEPDGEDSDGP